MEVQFTPDVQAKLDQMARDVGRRSDELVQDAVMGFLDELTFTREMLERRYHDLETGRVQPIDGEEAYRRLMAKTEERRHQRPASQLSQRGCGGNSFSRRTCYLNHSFRSMC